MLCMAFRLPPMRPLHRQRATVSTKVEQTCLSHGGGRLEACSGRQVGREAFHSKTSARKVGRWKLDEQRAVTELRGNSGVGRRRP